MKFLIRGEKLENTASIKDYIENIVPKFCFSEGTSGDSTTSVCR